MSPVFTVKSASQKSTKQTEYGPMQSIDLVLQEYGTVEEIGAEWYTKATTPLPQPGSQLEGEIQPSQYGRKFKKAASGFGGGRAGGGRSPEESRRIVRQHSQSRALQYVEFAHQRGTLPDDFKLADLTPIIDFFFRDVWGGA
jgi:hypothetical protein